MSNTNLVWGRGIHTLGSSFLKGVLENMQADSAVKFGETGMGIRPRYAVYHHGVSKPTTYRGDNHSFDSENPNGYDEEKISEAFFSYKDLLEAKRTAEILEQAKA